VDYTLHLTRAIDDREISDVGISRVGERSDVGIERIRAIDEGESEISAVGISRIRQGSNRVGVWLWRRRWEMDDIDISRKSFHQEARAVTRVKTFVGLHSDEPSLEGAHAADISFPHAIQGKRDAADARHGPVGAEAGDIEVMEHKKGQRRWLPVETRRGEPRATDGAHPGAVLRAGEAAGHGAEDVGQEVRPRPVQQVQPRVESWRLGARVHIVGHIASVAATDSRGGVAPWP
jgi:hypothetical protein